MSDLHWLKNDPLLLPGVPEPLQRRLYRVLREAVVEGRLQAGAVLPSTRALATHVRSIAAASSPRAGEAITSPGMSRSAAIELSLWKCPPNPF